MNIVNEFKELQESFNGNLWFLREKFNYARGNQGARTVIKDLLTYGNFQNEEGIKYFEDLLKNQVNLSGEVLGVVMEKWSKNKKKDKNVLKYHLYVALYFIGNIGKIVDCGVCPVSRNLLKQIQEELSSIAVSKMVNHVLMAYSKFAGDSAEGGIGGK